MRAVEVHDHAIPDAGVYRGHGLLESLGFLSQRGRLERRSRTTATPRIGWSR
jgi:hypothetical protein